MQEGAILHTFFGSADSVDIARHLRIALLRSHEFRENRREEGRAVFWPLINLHSRVYHATRMMFRN
jgi:hypothetical protein